MKNIKKVLSLVLALTMVFTITCTTAFAAGSDDHPMPEGLVGTTIELSLDPNEDAGIMPLIWDQKYPAVGNVPTNTSEFLVPDRYFAYECCATFRNGEPVLSGTSCTVDLMESLGIVASKTVPIDGDTYKMDWVDLEASNSTLHFKIYNPTSSCINVLITYYSWK